VRLIILLSNRTPLILSMESPSEYGLEQTIRGKKRLLNYERELNLDSPLMELNPKNIGFRIRSEPF